MPGANRGGGGGGGGGGVGGGEINDFYAQKKTWGVGTKSYACIYEWVKGRGGEGREI